MIGPANRFAHAAALAVAELPGQAYNPLFVYGPPGVGKTHLLHSIGNYVRRHGGGLTVRYTTVETFTNEFVAALRQGGLDRFKARYRHADVLLIDDVQFLAQKAKTEEEFFHTFNALQDDRQPARADLRPPPARPRRRSTTACASASRPASSPTSSRPTARTRLTVLRKRVEHDGIALADPAVLDLIADRVTTNVRALEGALIRVVAFASLTRPAGSTADLAAEVLDGLYPRGRASAAAAAAAPSVERIQDLTCEAFGLDARGARCRPAARPGSPGRARSRCTSRASTPMRRSRPIGASLRRPQPHHRHARLPARRRAPRLRPRGLRRCADELASLARSSMPTLDAPVHDRPPSDRLRAVLSTSECARLSRTERAFRHRAHLHSPYDS